MFGLKVTISCHDLSDACFCYDFSPAEAGATQEADGCASATRYTCLAIMDLFSAHIIGSHVTHADQEVNLIHFLTNGSNFV